MKPVTTVIEVLNETMEECCMPVFQAFPSTFSVEKLDLYEVNFIVNVNKWYLVIPKASFGQIKGFLFLKSPSS